MVSIWSLNHASGHKIIIAVVGLTRTCWHGLEACVGQVRGQQLSKLSGKAREWLHSKLQCEQ
jgi:hypothetical protein